MLTNWASGLALRIGGSSLLTSAERGVVDINTAPLTVKINSGVSRSVENAVCVSCGA